MKKIILFSIIALFAISMVSCKKSENSHTVRYTRQGSAKSTITYTDQDGNIQTVNNAESDWSTSFSSAKHGMTLKLTVISIDGTSIVGGKIFIDDAQKVQSDEKSSSISISAILP
jgi:hypothetical protein